MFFFIMKIEIEFTPKFLFFFFGLCGEKEKKKNEWHDTPADILFPCQRSSYGVFLYTLEPYEPNMLSLDQIALDSIILFLFSC